ncbi:ubiquitin carboxyl-terminal hydrolase CYLD isoform X2 [Xenopus tropicalis]|uniref:Ubiquitin carboxyl-terminal hydrolase CYLD n=1 Tax=Xenopus tropicalis TaxID=8364 RepID=A0A8J0SYV1_XENTR|nr:ubiquitin carboxyl-terminal hydrolase CYLD isoform X2 [Xenopus tropicalis]|eukprot:XP_012826702.1 PREDICTED: ubiquitin carboxyl-terminal hydrolase CYLD-like isoform X2 [Xenopus tropicalis]
MSSPAYFIAIDDFPVLPKLPDRVYEKVEKGSILIKADTPPSALVRVDPSLSPPPLWVKVQETQRIVSVDIQLVAELRFKVAMVLLAVTDTEERYAFYKDRRRLQEVIELKEGDPVRVQVTSSSGRRERGVLRYKGPVCQKQGILFGVQLVGSAVGKGFTDGSFHGQKFFHCEENCGVFVPGSRLDWDYNETQTRRGGKLEETSSARREEPMKRSRNILEKSQRTVNFLSRGVRQQSPQRAAEKGSDHLPATEERNIKTRVPEEHSPADGEAPQPLTTSLEGHQIHSNFHVATEDSLQLPSLYCPPKNGIPSSPLSETERKKVELELNSMVEVDEPPIYGVIRWIGQIPDSSEPIAGLEMELEMPSAGTDGIYRGNRYFNCGPNKALFVKLRNCRPDSRFYSIYGSTNQIQRCNSIAFKDYTSECIEENTPPVTGTEAIERLIGWKKGIQGHCNSCYLDATLFCMFACSSVLDTMLLRPPDKNDGDSYTETRDLLRIEIVNPLRKNGYVCATKVMALRKILEAAGKSTGFTSEEKDPEEFLNQLFQVLKVEPLFYIRTCKKKPQGCIFYQIFMEKRQSVNIPSVQQLLEWSMVTSDLKFTEAPSCLIIQMPRNGKNFKMFPTIIPTLELDITDLLEDTPRQCSICQSLAVVECQECYEDTGISPGHIKQYCELCSKQVHLHRRRIGHRPRGLSVPRDLSEQAVLHRQCMQLYAVLCIETSHYVAFIRHSFHHSTQWAFFDSMADREGGENGFNIPRVTPCPELTEYLKMTPEELQQEDPKTMPTYARRLLCDAYMCLYYSPDLSLYK